MAAPISFFFGTELTTGKAVSQEIPENATLNVTQAAFARAPAENEVVRIKAKVTMADVEEESRTTVVAVLAARTAESASLNLIFSPGEEVEFLFESSEKEASKVAVHLSGFYQILDDMEDEFDEEDELDVEDEDELAELEAAGQVVPAAKKARMGDGSVREILPGDSSDSDDGLGEGIDGDVSDQDLAELEKDPEFVETFKDFVKDVKADPDFHQQFKSMDKFSQYRIFLSAMNEDSDEDEDSEDEESAVQIEEISQVGQKRQREEKPAGKKQQQQQQGGKKQQQQGGKKQQQQQGGKKQQQQGGKKQRK